MPRCWLNLRLSLPERFVAFECGARRAGFAPVRGLPDASADEGDIFITWNRIGAAAQAAARAFPGLVLVVENAAWGNSFAGERWLSLARGLHNTAYCVPNRGPERWDRLGVDLAPWIDVTGRQTLILPQRGIGVAPTAMPRDWSQSALQRFPGARVRPHPGRAAPRTSLDDDLRSIGLVVTWGSSAAIRALMLGHPCISEMPRWIGKQNNTDAGRLAMFRALAWAQSTMLEIESGDAISRLLRAER